MHSKYDEGFEKLVHRFRRHRKVREMKQYMQHGSVTTYDHCEKVAHLSYRLNRWLHLHADEKTLTEGAMLHDFYLYDWHAEDDGTHKWHGYIHADRAADNARKFFDIGPQTEHVIRCHMWPLNLTRVPRSREAWIVCLADKWVSARETLFERR